MRSLGKKIVVGALVVIAVVCVLVFIALLLPQTVGLARAPIVDIVNDSLEGSVEIGELRGSIFGELSARDVVMRAPDGSRIATIPSATVDVALSSLLRRTVSVDVRATHAVAFVHRTADGAINLLDALPAATDEPSSPLPVAIELAISIDDSVVVWRDDGAEAVEGDALAALNAESTHDAITAAAAAVEVPATPPRVVPPTVALIDVALAVGVQLTTDERTLVSIEQLTAAVAAPEITASRELSLQAMALQIAADGVLEVDLTELSLASWLTASRLFLQLPEDLGAFAARGEQVVVPRAALQELAPEVGARADLTLSFDAGPHDGATALVARVGLGESPIELSATARDWVEPSENTAWSVTARTENLAVAERLAIAHPLNALTAVARIDGQGVDLDALKATIQLGVRDVEVDEFRLDALSLRATIDGMSGQVEELLLASPYADASASASLSKDGAFEVNATAQGTERAAEIAALLFGQKVDSRAQLTLSARGDVDLAQSEPLAILQKIDATVGWDIASFVAESLQIERSRGNFDLQVDNTAERADITLVGKADAKNIRQNALRLGALAADVDASIRANLAQPEPMDLAKALRARVDLDIDGLVAEGAWVRDIDVLAQLRPGNASSTYDVRGSASAVRAGDIKIDEVATRLTGTVTLGDTPTWPGALRAFTARGDASARGLDTSSELVTSLNAKINIGGPIHDLRGTVLADAGGLAMGDYAFESLDAKLDFVGGRIIEVVANGTQVDRQPSSLGVFVKVRHNQTLDDFELLELRFDSADEVWAISDGFTFDTAAQTMSFANVTLTHRDQTIFVDGEFRVGRDQNLRTEIKNLEIGSIARDFGIAALEPVRGRVDVTAQLGGTAREPIATFDVRLTDLYYDAGDATYGPFQVAARGTYGELDLIVEAVEIDGYDVRLLQGAATVPARITTTGEFDILTDRAIAADLQTPAFDPRRLGAIVPIFESWAVQGEVAMSTQLQGTLMSPKLDVELTTKQLHATPALESEQVRVGPIESVAKIRYRAPNPDDGGLIMSYVATIDDQPPVELMARVEANVAAWLREQLAGVAVDWESRLVAAPWRFIVQTEGFDLKQIRVGPLRAADVEGILDIGIIGDGSLAQPSANFEISLKGFGFQRYRDIYFDADVGIERDHLLLRRSRLEWDGDELLLASGRIPAPFETLFGDAALGDLPIDFEAQLQPMALSKLSAIDYSFASLTGQVQGKVEVGGRLAEPVGTARFSVDGVSFASGSTGGISAYASLSANDVVAGGITWTHDGKEALTASIELPVDINVMRLVAGEQPDLTGPVEATLRGDAPLAALLPSRFLDAYVRGVKGAFTADMKMTGTVEQPLFEGRVHLTNGEFGLPQFSREFTDVQLDLAAQHGQFQLNDLHVAGQRGFVSAEGTLAVDGWKPGTVDGKIEVNEFGTAGFADMAMFVWADVVLGGDFAASPATAKASIGNLEVVVPDTSDLTTHATTLDSDIVVIRTQADREALFVTDGHVEPVSTVPYATLAVEIESGGKVRHPLAQVEVAGAFDLRLSDAGPTLLGEVYTERGTAQFLGKRFDIQQGIVTFTGADPPDPRLQVEAAYKLDRNITRDIGQPTSGDPRAIVRVTGRSSDPRIRFLSDPQMSESDVIYVLLTNRPPNRGQVGETGLASGAASGLLTGLIADSPVGKVFDVRVEAGAQGFSDASIEVGRYITPNVFISVDFKSGANPNENNSEFNIEYRFLPRWVFELGAGDRGTGEANVFWDLY